MKKRVNKKKSFFKLKILSFLLVVYVSYDISYSILIDKNMNLSNEKFLKLLTSETNHHIIYKYKPKKIIATALSLFSNIDINNPTSILDINFLNQNAVEVNGEHVDNYDPIKLEKVTKYIKDPNPIIVEHPRVYIYNSHQLENYNASNLEIYNIQPNVMMASYMLKEKLNNLGIPSIVEEANLTEFMRINHWQHKDSYKASRIFILDAKNKYDTLEYYIDIHRDSIRENLSTAIINDKRYAKVLFLIGLDNPNYKSNLKLTENINKIINKKYPGLSRGIYKKQGKGVDGVYNQDISSKAILIEVGGVDNTIEDVLNTVEALSHVLFECIEG